MTPQLLRLARTVLSERSLYEFCKQAWHIIEPGIKFVDGWHVRAICLECQELVDNPGGRLLINIPPGCMKSLVVNVFFPAWVWGPRGWDAARFFHASYSPDLGVRDSVRCRHLIESDWYAAQWGGRFHLTSDQNQKGRFENSGRGYRISSTIGGRVTGEHPDFKILDDPHDIKKAESEKERTGACDWYDRTLSSRGKNRGARTIITMQRLHESDLSGHVLKKQADEIHKGTLADAHWIEVCFPMRYEPDRMTATPCGTSDPRTELGGLLWPDVFDEITIKSLENELGQAATAGQLQQRPPEHYEGAEWPANYFTNKIYFDEWPAPQDIVLRICSLDPSKGATEKSDYQAYINMAITGDGLMWIQADMVREDISKIAVRCFQHSAGFNPDAFAIEENFFNGMLSASVHAESKANGFMIPVVEIYNRIKKTQRIRLLTPYLSKGEFRFKSGCQSTAILISQLKSFPGGLHDDGPDALEMAVRTAREIMFGG
jgi:predicted phage terminase large subunit-like protein